MADRPLGIADITKALADTDHPAWPALPDHWYWCRRHSPTSGPEHVSEERRGLGTAAQCILIGPFMSEREANRLDTSARWSNDPRALGPLGMEVEK